MISLADRRQLIAQAFQQHRGTTPSLWVRAPGRVDLMGSHTDYNLGHVLTLPIDRDTWIAARPRTDRNVCLWSINLQCAGRFHLDCLQPSVDRSWVDYVAGVAHVLQAEGLPITGWDGAIHSTVPLGSGLSSSAALECASATVFETLGGFHLGALQKASLCQRAENTYVGVQCGILDQFTSCAGQAEHALLLDCRDLTSQAVPLPEELGIVICDTRAPRALAGSEYGVRRAQCEQGARLLGVAALRDVSEAVLDAAGARIPPVVARRCRFILQEHARVQQLAQALTRADLEAIRTLTEQSFQGACELYEIGVPAMHTMMRAMLQAPGVIGARQAGAGFGGCMLAWVHRAQVDDFARAVHHQYAAHAGVTPDVYPVQAAAGAGLIS